jgi:uncharacterized protein
MGRGVEKIALFAMRSFDCFFKVILVQVVFISLAFAQAQAPRNSPTPKNPTDDLRDRVNSGSVGFLSASLSGTYAQIASEMMVVLDQGDDLRILPVITRGSIQNVRDLLYLKGMDVALIQSDTLTFLESQKTYSNIKSRIHYIAPLFIQECHLIGGKGVEKIEDLANKAVNFSDPGSGVIMTATLIFQRFGIPVKQVNMSQPEAFEKIKTGEVAASMWCASKPITGVTKLRAEDGFRLIPIPFRQEIADLYLPAELTTADYPALVPSGQSIEIIGLSGVLAAYNWPVDSERYRKVANFVNALFSKIDDFRKPPFHPKWKDVNLAAELRGWTRFKAAQDWLDRFRTNQNRQATGP